MGYFGIIGFRKIIFAVNLVLLNGFPALNLTIFAMINITTVIYLVKVKPNASMVHLIRDVITEISFLSIFLASIPLLSGEISESI